MSFFRSVLIASLISLFAAVCLLFIGFSMGYEEFRGGYAVLSVDASNEDRQIRSLLVTSGYNVGEPICESSQWVMLDRFDSIQRIPLDEYFSRVFPFDPRYDGYAEKLRAVFVREGKRYFYMPLMAGNWNPGKLDKSFSLLLGEIPFSVDYYGIGRPFALFFIIYAAASVILLALCYVNRKNHRSIVNIVPMVPVLSSLGFFGAAGIGCAALLFGLFILLKEPLHDLINPAEKNAKGFEKRMQQLYKEIILPYRYYWLFLPVFIIAFGILILFSPLTLLFLLLVFAVSFSVFFFSLKIVIFSGVEHKRFNPVTIIRRRFPHFVFPVYILPFVIGAFLAVFFTPFMSGTIDSDKKFDNLVGEDDYLRHISFQASFSRNQLNADYLNNDFPSFFFDSEGLPSMIAGNAKQNINFNEYPSFPLKNLIDFFGNVKSGENTVVSSETFGEMGGKTSNSRGGLAENLSLLVLLVFLLPGLILRNYEYIITKTKLANLRTNVK